ncbi:CPBP family intramembrane glutamic endopeptidase [Halobium salinum]|uniref:CPBP family intramembrane glutamic endopeptidase n=1 Tax=Halobium salinum TaxID=1364940 RepID=A0ABD5PGL1_9EURY|nr:CPBP family intramembrane glutamic endopeptidase [Halobium salinum]
MSTESTSSAASTEPVSSESSGRPLGDETEMRSATETRRPPGSLSPARPSLSGRSRTVLGRGVALLVAVSLVVVAAGLGAAVVAGLVLAELVPMDASAVVYAAVVTRLAFFGVAFAYVVRRLDGVDLRLPTRAERRWTLGGLLAALVLVFGALTVGRFTGVDTATTLLRPFVVADPFILLLLGVASVFVVAPAEELLFRGAVQGRLGRSFGPTTRIVLASALFAAVHALGFGFDPATAAFGLAVVFAVGVVLGTVYEGTENLAVPVLVHGLYQAALFAVAVLVVV